MYQQNILPESSSLSQAKPAKKYHLTSEISFLSEEGDVITVDELSGEYYGKLEVLALDKHGRLTTTSIHSFELVSSAKTGYTISFTSGLTITLPEGTSLLTPSNETVKVEELEFGSLVQGTIYDPKRKCPSYSNDEVLHIHKVMFKDPEPLYSFWSITSDKTILVTGNTSRIPVCALISLETLNDSNK